MKAKDNPLLEAWNALSVEERTPGSRSFPCMRYIEAISIPSTSSPQYYAIYTYEGESIYSNPNVGSYLESFLQAYTAFCKRHGFMHNDLHDHNVMYHKERKELVVIDLGRAWIPPTNPSDTSIPERLRNDFSLSQPLSYQELARENTHIRMYLAKLNGYVFDILSFCMTVYREAFQKLPTNEKRTLPIQWKETKTDTIVTIQESVGASKYKQAFDVLAPGYTTFIDYVKFRQRATRNYREIPLKAIDIYDGGFQCTSVFDQWYFLRCTRKYDYQELLPTLGAKEVDLVRKTENWIGSVLETLFQGDSMTLPIYVQSCTLFRICARQGLSKDFSDRNMLMVCCVYMSLEAMGENNLLAWELPYFLGANTEKRIEEEHYKILLRSGELQKKHNISFDDLPATFLEYMEYTLQTYPKEELRTILRGKTYADYLQEVTQFVIKNESFIIHGIARKDIQLQPRSPLSFGGRDLPRLSSLSTTEKLQTPSWSSQKAGPSENLPKTRSPEIAWMPLSLQGESESASKQQSETERLSELLAQTAPDKTEKKRRTLLEPPRRGPPKRNPSTWDPVLFRNIPTS